VDRLSMMILGFLLLLALLSTLTLLGWLFFPMSLMITIGINDASKCVRIPLMPPFVGLSLLRNWGTVFIGFGILLTLLIISLIVILAIALLWRSGGITVSFKENTYESLIGKKAEFLTRLSSELRKRGYSAKVMDEDTLLYEDFFNRAHLYISSEGKGVRFGFRLELRNACLLLIILLTLFGLIPVALILCIIWFIKYNALREALTLAGEATARALSSDSSQG